MTESPNNLLYYGDNLDILRRYLSDETVDLFTWTRLSTPMQHTTSFSRGQEWKNSYRS